MGWSGICLNWCRNWSQLSAKMSPVNLPDNLLGEAWCWTAWAVWLVALRPFCLARALGAIERRSEHLNVWLGMIVLLTFDLELEGWRKTRALACIC